MADISASQEREKENFAKTPLLDHLIELRKRLLYCFGFFLVAFAVSYLYAESVYQILQQPLVRIFGDNHERRMIYTGLHEAFFTYLKLAFFSALFVTLPLILIQVWKFFAPGLYQHEKRACSVLFCFTPVLFVAGAALAFYVVMPLAWEFFISFESQNNQGLSVELEARMSEYLGLVIKLILAFGISFELPIFLIVLAKAGLVTTTSLKTYRRHAIVVVFLFAAFITPPDLISQIALGVPIVILYELSIWLIKVTEADSSAQQKHSIRQAASNK